MPADAPDPILDDLRRTVAELSEGRLRPEAIDPTQPMLDFGYIDSLTAVMLLAHIEETWGLEVEEIALMQSAKTLASLAALVKAHHG